MIVASWGDFFLGIVVGWLLSCAVTFLVIFLKYMSYRNKWNDDDD